MTHKQLSIAKLPSVLLSASIMAIGSVAPTHAFTTFTSRDAWEDAVFDFSIITESFDAAEFQLLQDGDTVTLPTGITLTAQAPTSFSAGSITSGSGVFAGGNSLLGDLDPGDALIISLPQSSLGIGFDYIDVDLDGVTLTALLDGDDELDAVDVPLGADASAPSADFFGILADRPLTTFTLSLAGDSLETWDLDNLSIATEETDAKPVPEPNAAIALGLLGLGIAGNRRVKRSLSRP